MSIRAYKAGSGSDVIVAMHGWRSNSVALYPLASLLESDFTVHSIDLPGFGASPEPLEAWNTAQYANAVKEYIQANVGARVHLLGHSFGGQIAAELALDTELVKSLVLIAPAIVPARQSLRQRASRQLGRIFRLVKWANASLGERLIDWRTQKFASEDFRLSSPVMRQVMTRVVYHDRPALFARVVTLRTPTLLLWGDQDKATPVYMAYELKEKWPHAEMVILPGKDHFPFKDTGADLCATKISDFLKRNLTK